MKHNDNSVPLLKSTEVSRILNVHINTVRRWTSQGMLNSYRIGPRGDRRFKLEEIGDFLTREGEICRSTALVSH